MRTTTSQNFTITQPLGVCAGTDNIQHTLLLAPVTGTFYVRVEIFWRRYSSENLTRSTRCDPTYIR